MGNTSDLRSELKRTFFPLAESRGFAIDLSNAPHLVTFRRTIGNSLHVFDVQWEKYGRPRFVVNFGTCPARGLSVSGKDIPSGQVLASWAPQSGRLQPRTGASSVSWFRQDRSFMARLAGAKPHSATQVVGQLIQLFPELEAYWSTGEIGKHLKVITRVA